MQGQAKKVPAGLVELVPRHNFTTFFLAHIDRKWKKMKAHTKKYTSGPIR